MNAKMMFVTGTDTDVGKTFVSSNLLKRLNAHTVTTGVCKPFATGSIPGPDGQPVCKDTLTLKTLAGVDDDLATITPVLLHAPLAPNWAARLDNKEVDVIAAQQSIGFLSQKYEQLIVEGIGGVMVPLTDTLSFLDFMTDYNAPVLIVARLGLGTLNHTLLTVNALKQRQIPIAGVVLNSASQAQHSVAADSNLENLRMLLDVPVFGIIPYKPIGKQLTDILDLIIEACFDNK